MRIVITGMGAVTPIGLDVESFWGALCRGENGIRPVTRFEVKDMMFSRGGEIAGYALPAGLGPEAGQADLAVRFMLGAAAEAIRQAGLEKAGFQPETGVVLSTNFGGVASGETALSGSASAGAGFANLSFQAPVDLLARIWRFTGPALAVSLSCSSGTAAIGLAADLIRAGRAKAVVAGGYDALSRFAWSGLSVLRTMSKDAVRPFDKNRDGTIFSDGAGALVIEAYEHAVTRGAPILAEVLGYGLNNNAFHMTAPAKEGAGSAAVMKRALADAGLRPDEVDHVNAHGTGTKPNDVTETQAIKAVFGAHAAAMPVTSIKGSTGHLMGAAGSLEAIASVLTLRDGVVPPTINFREADPECDLDYVFNAPRKTAVRTVLSNSAGIGGCNAAVILRKP
jgi:3-oxoacyl-(acyl-carrier-protein) synthase